MDLKDNTNGDTSRYRTLRVLRNASFCLDMYIGPSRIARHYGITVFLTKDLTRLVQCRDSWWQWVVLSQLFLVHGAHGCDRECIQVLQV